MNPSSPLSTKLETASPFVSSPDEREAHESNVELTLPHEQDGTGRFTRPSSPSYAADDEIEEDELDEALKANRSKIVVPSIKEPSIQDSGASNSDLDNDSDLDALEVTSSILISGSEIGRRDSSTSQRRRRISEWENGAGSSSLSTSWAWMNVEGSSYSRRGKERVGRSTEILPVVFTSGSEGEEETLHKRSARSQRRQEEEEAFEEALENAPTAQSAGLMARAPKRRHRKNGESAKGSKRSNSSAVPASDMRLSRRSAALRSRRPMTSNLSASARSASHARYEAQVKGSSAAEDNVIPETQSMLKAILRKVFLVDDDEVLQAFLRDEGPLRVDECSSSSKALETSSALAVISSQHKDDIWTRTERNRHLRGSHAFVEESVEYGEVEEKGQMMRIPRSTSASEIFAAPHRIKLQSNVGEPTLLEALQASVLSGLATVPSGFSILLAGSRSARLVNYLAGRFVGQIGPSFTERMRKLIDDAEDDTSIQDDILGSETRSSSSSSTRFRGSSHPAISSRSSSTMATP